MKIYTYDEVIEKSTEYFEGDTLAASVFATKYALTNQSGELIELTPDDMHKRIAKEFARIESKYKKPLSEKKIYSLLKDFKYIIPQGSPLSGIGNKNKYQSLSNCFVISPPQDSYPGIIEADKKIALIQRRRGGVGVDLSRLRPYGTKVRNAANSSDGVSLFMQRYSRTTEEVAQSGRRGALMQTLDIRHPDIEKFINIKRDLNKVTGANVSVKITDKFMEAVVSDSDFTLQWPVDAVGDDIKVSKIVKAKDIWEQLIDAAWFSAEPGILFWDRVTQMTPADIYSDEGYASVSCNPCGELPLPGCDIKGKETIDSCRLMALNTMSYVNVPFTEHSNFNYDLFSEHVKYAQKLMDDLVDLEIESIDSIIEKVKSDPESDEIKQGELKLWETVRRTAYESRRTGLGVTAVGDTIAMLNIKYGSQESIEFVEQLYKCLAIKAHESSADMAVDRGPFPIWKKHKSDGHPFMMLLDTESNIETISNYRDHGRRNICLTTTAPVGTISILTRSTSGIEPTIKLEYKRKKKISDAEIAKGVTVDVTDETGNRWHVYDVKHHMLQKWCEVTGESDITKSPYWGATSEEIDWMASVKLQATAQKWIEHSISKTCNLPADATHELVSDVYIEAWRSGCKGFTVYRDGSRDGVIISTDSKLKLDLAARLGKIPNEELNKLIQIGDKYKANMPQAHMDLLRQIEFYLKNDRKVLENSTVKFSDRHAPKRLKELNCEIFRLKVKGEQYLAVVGLLDGRPYEIFCGLSDKVEVPKKFKSGVLAKNGKKDGISTYNLHVKIEEDDELVFKDIVSLFDNTIYGSFTRMLSLSLRHGVPIQYVFEQLQKHKQDDMQSFAKVISRVLKQYIPNGTKSATQKVCESCGDENITYQESCLTCLNCGYSKCS